MVFENELVNGQIYRIGKWILHVPSGDSEYACRAYDEEMNIVKTVEFPKWLSATQAQIAGSLLTSDNEELFIYGMFGIGRLPVKSSDIHPGAWPDQLKLILTNPSTIKEPFVVDIKAATGSQAKSPNTFYVSHHQTSANKFYSQKCITQYNYKADALS